jgi:hypothetical protein
MDVLLQYTCVFYDLPIWVNYVYWKAQITNFLFSIFLPLLLSYPHTFLSSRPPIILIYGLLTSETPENKMGEEQAVPEYTNLPRVFHAGKKGTIINTNRRPVICSASPESELNNISRAVFRI